MLFRWKEALKPEPTFAPVQVTDAAPVVESPTVPSTPGIEIELTGGRRMQFERDADPKTVRRLWRCSKQTIKACCMKVHVALGVTDMREGLEDWRCRRRTC